MSYPIIKTNKTVVYSIFHPLIILETLWDSKDLLFFVGLSYKLTIMFPCLQVNTLNLYMLLNLRISLLNYIHNLRTVRYLLPHYRITKVNLYDFIQFPLCWFWYLHTYCIVSEEKIITSPFLLEHPFVTYWPKLTFCLWLNGQVYFFSKPYN